MSDPNDTPELPFEGAVLVEQRVDADGAVVAHYRSATDSAADSPVRHVLCVDGVRLVDSSERRSERELVRLSMAPLGQRDDVTVLVAGLGLGHTVRAVLEMAGVQRVDVIERSQAVLDYNRGPLGSLAGRPLDDPRVHVHHGELFGVLKRFRYEPIEAVKEGWMAIIVDVDDGPSMLQRSDNAALYADDGLARLEQALRHGGMLGLWSGVRELPLLQALHARFVQVAELLVPVDVPGPGLDYVYRARRAPDAHNRGTLAQA